MSEFEYHDDGKCEHWFEHGKLVRARDRDGRQRFYSYTPKAHLEYVRLKNGDEWYAHDGRTARPEA